MHYLTALSAEYSRARLVVKRRASLVVVWSAVANALIAVAGVVIAVTGRPWIGIVSTALVGVVTVLGAWDGLFRHRELWVQRTLILSQLQAIDREARLRQALGQDRDTLGKEVMTAVDSILVEDMASWSSIRHTQATPLKSDGANDAQSKSQ